MLPLKHLSNCRYYVTCTYLYISATSNRLNILKSFAMYFSIFTTYLYIETLHCLSLQNYAAVCTSGTPVNNIENNAIIINNALLVGR